MNNELDKRRLEEKFTEIVGSGLHYYEIMNKLDLSTCTAKDITDATEGWVNRFRNDVIFHNKVDSLVAQLIIVTDDSVNAVLNGGEGDK